MVILTLSTTTTMMMVMEGRNAALLETMHLYVYIRTAHICLIMLMYALSFICNFSFLTHHRIHLIYFSFMQYVFWHLPSVSSKKLNLIIFFTWSRWEDEQNIESRECVSVSKNRTLALFTTVA